LFYTKDLDEFPLGICNKYNGQFLTDIKILKLDQDENELLFGYNCLLFCDIIDADVMMSG